MKPWQNLTDMFSDSEQIEEMAKKYKNTYLRLTTDRNSTLALYCGYDEDEFHIFKDRFGALLKIKHVTDVQINIWNPRRGLYNTSKGVVMFLRSPFRQFRRGLNNESGKIVTLRRYMSAAAQSNILNELVYEVFDGRLNKTTPLVEAIERLKLNREWAINREFAVTLNHLDDDPEKYSLFYEQYFIGSIKNNEISLIASEFLQEVLDTQHEWAPEFIVRG